MFQLFNITFGFKPLFSCDSVSFTLVILEYIIIIILVLSLIIKMDKNVLLLYIEIV